MTAYCPFYQENASSGKATRASLAWPAGGGEA
jgi:hypothetical protein